MTNTEGIKYACGCGKQYSSYPAYSTHKRLKHNNQEINGSSIPKVLMPKRGRPSFSRPAQTHASHTHSALTIVEAALLKLQQNYAPILAQPENQPDYTLLDIYQDCQKAAVTDLGSAAVEAVKKFNHTLVTHTAAQLGASVTQFLADLALFFLQNMSVRSIKLEWEQAKQETRVEGYLFNKFFNNERQRQNVQQYARDCRKPFKVFVQLTVALSEYLCKLGITDSVLRLRP